MHSDPSRSVDNSLRKAAILVSALDSASADALLERMGPERASRVRNAIMYLEEITQEEEEQVLAQFMQGGPPVPPGDAHGIELDGSLARTLAASPDDYDRRPATGVRAGDKPPFQFLHEATADSLARHLAHEHPQVTAVVAAHLAPRRAAELLKHFEPSVQADVLRRVAELDEADPQVLQDLQRQLEVLLSEDIRAAKNRSAGLAAVTSILNAAGTDRAALLQNLNRHDRSLATQLANPRTAPRATPQPSSPATGQAPQVRETPRTQAPKPPPNRSPSPQHTPENSGQPREEASKRAPHSIPFDALSGLDDAGWARLLREADPQVLLLAMVGAEQQLMERLLRRLPEREAKALRRRVQHMGPVRLTDIEAAQQQLADTAARLAGEGQLTLPQAKRFAVAV